MLTAEQRVILSGLRSNHDTAEQTLHNTRKEIGRTAKTMKLAGAHVSEISLALGFSSGSLRRLIIAEVAQAPEAQGAPAPAPQEAEAEIDGEVEPDLGDEAETDGEVEPDAEDE